MPGAIAEETVILDACCVLNLYATGQIAGILGILPHRFAVGGRARQEAQFIRVAPDVRQPIDLAPLFDAGVLQEHRLATDEEVAMFTRLSAALADGEAEAAALAITRGWILATDDRKARHVIAMESPGVRFLSTLDLLFDWQERGAIGSDAMAEALRHVESRATFRPRRADPLWPWWTGLTGANP